MLWFTRYILFCLFLWRFRWAEKVACGGKSAGVEALQHHVEAQWLTRVEPDACADSGGYGPVLRCMAVVGDLKLLRLHHTGRLQTMPWLKAERWCWDSSDDESTAGIQSLRLQQIPLLDM